MGDEEGVLFKDDLVTTETKDTGSKLMTTTEEEPPTRATHTQLTTTQLKPEPTTEETETVTKMEEIEEKLNKKELNVEEYLT